MSPNEIIGTIGVGMILIAYFLNIFTLIKKEGVLFFTLNIIGGLIACIASILIRFWPFIILEGTWTMASIFGLLKSIKKPQE
jgi:nucleoside recognition membrane protein YjiH